MTTKAAATKFSIEMVDNVAQQLNELPTVEERKTTVSKADAIKRLSKEMQGLIDKRYTIKMIAEVLTEKGIPITAAVLRPYLLRCDIKMPRQRKTCNKTDK